MRLHRPFEPHPEDADVLDSILDYPVEPGDQADDHDDSRDPGPVPSRIRRFAAVLTNREKPRG